MQAIAVVKHLNVMNHITSRIAPVTIKHPGSPLCFHAVKKTFRNSIVPAIALSAHATDHAIAPQKILVITASILAAAVRVMYQSLFRLSSPISHGKCIRGKRCLYAVAHRPTNNFSREQVDYRCQI